MINEPISNQTQQREFWRQHVAAFVASGITQRAYCKLNNVSYTKFKSWRYRFPDHFPSNENNPNSRKSRANKTNKMSTDQDKANIFTEVTVVDTLPKDTNKVNVGDPVKLYINQDMYMELPVDVSPEYLANIFMALGVKNVNTTR